MASALRLDDTPVAGPAAPFDQPDEGIGLSDYARAVAAGGYGVVGSTVGALDYLFNLPADTDVSRARAWAQRGAQAQIEQMSPAAQRALTANVLPGDGETIWDKNVSTSGALGLRTAQAIPSLLASIIPGGVVARVTASAGAGMAVGTGLAGMQSGGDLFNQISDELTKTPDDRLQTESEAYRGLRSMGMEEPEAKRLLVQQSAGYKPIIMAAITALTSRYGVEGMVAHRAAGQAGRGALRHGALGAVSEATQEGIENFSQELLAQQGVFDAKGGAGNYDWHKALEQAVGGALVGATTGGAVGAATGGGRRHAVSNRLIDQDHEAALAPAPASEPRVVTPEVTPTGPEVVLDQKGTVAGHEMDALDKTVKDAGANAGVVQHVDTPTTAPATPAGIGVDEAAALAPKLGENRNASIQGNMEPSDVAPPPPLVPNVPVVAPQMARAIGAAPVQTAVQPAEPSLPQPGQPGGLQAPAQPAPERAAAPALAALPPVPAGHTRFYHGGLKPTTGGERYVTPQYEYARNYRGGPNEVHYVDVPNDHPSLVPASEGDPSAGFLHFRAPEALAKQLRPVEPAPEAPETIAAQFASARAADSPRQAVLVTKGERLPKGELARGFRKVELPEGNLYVKTKWASENKLKDAAAIKAWVGANGFEGLIGKVAPVADTTTGPALVTRDAGGTELASSIVPTPEAAVQQAAVDQAQFPQAAQQEVVPAQAVVARRVIEGGTAVEDKSGKLKSPTAKNAPRMGKLKKAQIEAGVAPEEVLSAKELRTKKRQDELSGLAERVRAAQAKLAEPDASKGAPAARAYARELVAASEIGDVKLGNLAADADPALRLIKAAVQVGKGAGRASDAIAFTGTDLDVRKGATAGPRYVGGTSLNEDIGDTEGVKGGSSLTS
jgi:hypothetical protein